MSAAAIAIIVGVLIWLFFAVPTAAGCRVRGYSRALAVVAGALFLATWTAWYVRDDVLTRHLRARPSRRCSVRVCGVPARRQSRRR